MNTIFSFFFIFQRISSFTVEHVAGLQKFVGPPSSFPVKSLCDDKEDSWKRFLGPHFEAGTRKRYNDSFLPSKVGARSMHFLDRGCSEVSYIHSPIHSFIHPFIHSSIRPSIHPFIHPTVHFIIFLF
jgi:hypothetical protein